MIKDKEYTGKETEIVMLAEAIPVGVGEAYACYGVDCIHEQVTVKTKNGEQQVNILSAVVPKQLADEMIANERGHLRSDIKIVEAAKEED